MPYRPQADFARRQDAQRRRRIRHGLQQLARTGLGHRSADRMFLDSHQMPGEFDNRPRKGKINSEDSGRAKAIRHGSRSVHLGDPSQPMPIIDQLRTSANPAVLVKANAIRTQPASGSFAGTQTGGLCELTETKSGSLYTLTATANKGSDYFYPWLQRSYGWVKVPSSVSDGTIVSTGGLNGCTLIVSRKGSDLYFYHDGDSKYLPKGSGSIEGDEIVRIKPDDYDPGDVVHKSFVATMTSYSTRGLAMPSGDVSYGIYIVWVKVGGQFIAISSSVVAVGSPVALPGAEVGRFTP